jgi:hypothetical protein
MGAESFVPIETHLVANFLRSRIAFPGTTVRTEGSSEGRGKIEVDVPDIPVGKAVNIFRLKDNTDVHQFHQRVIDAGGLNFSIKVNKKGSGMNVFNIGRYSVRTRKDRDDMNFLVDLVII